MLFPFNIYSVLNLESDVCMNGIPSFKAAYPTNENVNVKTNNKQQNNRFAGLFSTLKKR